MTDKKYIEQNWRDARYGQVEEVIDLLKLILAKLEVLTDDSSGLDDE
jgi:hypothetical protein